jgi:Ras-related protein Rab-1A
MSKKSSLKHSSIPELAKSPEMKQAINKTIRNCVFKIILVGMSGVGKSSIILRYADDIFNEYQWTTVGIDFKVMTIVVDNIHIRLQIWDSCGQEQFTSIPKSFIRGIHGVLLVYDITDIESFMQLDSYWHTEYKDVPDYHDASKMLVGNKLDLESKRTVKKDLAHNYADEMKWSFYECSARYDRTVINKIMLQLVHNILIKEKYKLPSQVSRVDIRSPENNNKDDSCC